MKKILIIAGIVILGIFVLGFFKDIIIKDIVTAVASNVTGAPVRIDSLSLGIFKQAVLIKGFKIYNPKGFSGGILVDLPKIYVKYSLASILKNKLHILNADIELKELVMIKNKDGKLNTDSLKVAKKEEKPASQKPLQIDTLKLKLGRVVSKDYTQGEEPNILVYDLNIDRTYKNITSSQQLAILILTEPMKSAGIKGAQIYGVSALAGVAILPAAAAITLMGKDSSEEYFYTSADRVFNTSENVLKPIGIIKVGNKATGIIEAQVNGADIKIEIEKAQKGRTKIKVSARKFLIPKPEVAGGILYRISEKLK